MLTGGSFGPEASLIAVLTCLVPAVFLIRKAARRSLVVPFRLGETETTAPLQVRP